MSRFHVHPADRVARRLPGVPSALHEPIAFRDVEACTRAVEILEQTWAGGEHACCRPYASLGPDDDRPFVPACEHLLALWAAREYLGLARCNAPQGVFPCKCSGTGVFHSGGAVVNGQFTGRTGVCYGCGGKGYQHDADRRRNAYYWDHVARVSI